MFKVVLITFHARLYNTSQILTSLQLFFIKCQNSEVKFTDISDTRDYDQFVRKLSAYFVRTTFECEMNI